MTFECRSVTFSKKSTHFFLISKLSSEHRNIKPQMRPYGKNGFRRQNSQCPPTYVSATYLCCSCITNTPGTLEMSVSNQPLLVRKPVVWDKQKHRGGVVLLVICLGGMESHVPCTNPFLYQSTPGEVTSVRERDCPSGCRGLRRDADQWVSGDCSFAACIQLALRLCPARVLLGTQSGRHEDSGPVG